MSDLKKHKNYYKLAIKTSLSPELHQVTRLGSTYSILNKYEKLAGILPTCNFDASTNDLIPTPREQGLIRELLEHLEKFNDVSIWLQTQKVKKEHSVVNLHTVRLTFNYLLNLYPDLRPCLADTGRIVQDALFEKAVAKIQSGEFYNDLSPGEKSKLKVFKIAEPVQQAAQPIVGAHFLSGILHTAHEVSSNKRARADKQLRSLDHICTTSNFCERLVSRT
jgi:hypothetical protein